MSPPQAHTTCDDCVRILADAVTLLSPTSVKDTTKVVLDSSYHIRLGANVSSSTCHMCLLLSALVPRLLEPPDSSQVLGLAISRDRRDSNSATVGLVGYDRAALDRETHYPGSLRIQDVEHGRVCDLDSPSTWSLETLKRVRSWVNQCILSHDTCAKPLVAGRLPLRLIDVMSTGSSHPFPTEQMTLEGFHSLSLERLSNVRIVSSNSLPSDTPYLTLSHRWGSPPRLLLTTETRFLLSDDASPHILNCREAAVFRHAIHVTRCLGFRYVWIDALCIMQDDALEKMAEIMKMDEIYRNSTLNISATEARLRDGLVFHREPLYLSPCRPIMKNPKTQEDVHLQVFPNKWFLGPSEGPLNKRGWVFQERRLAPRIVHFTKDQVFWECRALEASEVLPEGMPGQASTRLGVGVGIPESPVQQVKSRWYELVEEYSHTSVSFADDRLLAISAVAKWSCSAMRLDPSEYLAGIWEDDLPLSMLWSQYSPQHVGGSDPMPSIGAELKHAPSWSWASILAPIRSVELSSLTATAEILEVQIVRVSPNFFDGAKSCRLRLRGPVCKFRRLIREGSPLVSIGLDTEFEEFSDFEFQQGWAIILEWDTARKEVADELKIVSRASASSTYFLFHIATENSVDGSIQRGIILRRTTVPGTYTRIGCFFIPFRSKYPGSELEDAFSGNLGTLRTDDYFELDPAGKYTIDIV